MAQNGTYFGRKEQKKLKNWTKEELEKIEECGLFGMVEHQIAVNMGISYASLQHYKKQSKEFHAAIERGRSRGQRIVGDALVKKCQTGTPKAIELYYKLTGRIQLTPDPNEKDLGTVVESHDGATKEHHTVLPKDREKVNSIYHMTQEEIDASKV